MVKFKMGIALLIVSIILFGNLQAIEKRLSARDGAVNYSMAGVRLGAWVDQGGQELTPDATADLNKTGFYTELFYDQRLVQSLFLEISMGIASRGEVVVERETSRFIGTLNLYPLLLQIKFSPLDGHVGKVKPFIIGGGGVMFGKHNIDVVTGTYINYWDYYDAQKSQAKLIGVFGGGLDIIFSRKLGLNLIAKYHPVKFGEELAGVRDFSGLSISAGFSYFLYKGN